MWGTLAIAAPMAAVSCGGLSPIHLTLRRCLEKDIVERTTPGACGTAKMNLMDRVTSRTGSSTDGANCRTAVDRRMEKDYP